MQSCCLLAVEPYVNDWRNDSDEHRPPPKSLRLLLSSLSHFAACLSLSLCSVVWQPTTILTGGIIASMQFHMRFPLHYFGIGFLNDSVFAKTGWLREYNKHGGWEYEANLSELSLTNGLPDVCLCLQIQSTWQVIFAMNHMAAHEHLNDYKNRN